MATTAAPATGVPPQNAAPPPAVVPDPIAPAPVIEPPPPAPEVQIAEEDRAAGALVVDQHVAVPHEAFRKIKDTAAAKGRREQEAAMNARAVALGFPTAEALFAHLETPETPMATIAPPPALTPPAAASPAAAPAPIAPAPVAPPPAAAHPPAAAAPPPGVEDPNAPENDRRVPDQVRKKLRQAREDMRTKTATAEAAAAAAQQTAQQYQQQMETMRVEQTMREDLIRGGMRDLDFGFFELKKHLAALTADKTPEGVEKLKTFDLKVWAEEQRKARPYLFGEQPVPANTGTSTPAPAAPNPGAVTGAAGDASKIDARNLPADEFTKRMKAMGINTGGSAPPPRR